MQLITTLLVSYPLASLYVYIAGTSANLCHLFSLAVSYIYLVPLLGLHAGFWHLVLSCLGVYLIVVGIRGPHMPWVAFL
jgi:lysophospholipid acyltransferase